jgi:CPA1 family monovalent cation:H+ antiporter
MSGFEVLACIVSLTAILGYLNSKLLRLPSAIGLMATAMLLSLCTVALDASGIFESTAIDALLERIDFARVLMHGLLGFLLFAGALHVDLADLRANRWTILLLAVLSTFLSTFMIGGATWWILHWLGHDIGVAPALLFGALISPTDPIAVLGILKSAKLPRQLAIQISGESLFNDGIGVVIFIVIAGASGGDELSLTRILALFAREALGGALFGLAVGYVGYRVLRSIDDYSVLNAVLFLLLGLQATRLEISRWLLVGMVLVVPVTVLARFASVAVTVPLLRGATKSPHYVKILTWGGLRGGISVALALSLEPGPVRGAILGLTYAVVAFSILAQGLSLKWFLRRLEHSAAG